MSVNNITLVGRAGKDPEIRYFESGTVLAEFSIATSRPGKEGETDWHQIKLWGKSAQVAADYLRKGHLVGVTGRLEYEKWSDKNTGEKRSKPVVVANAIQLLTSKAEAAAMRGEQSAAQSESTAPAPTDPFDVPF